MPLVTTEMNISSALKNVHIIPDVIEDENFAPVAMIDIEYPSSGQKVEMGNRLTPQETAEKPKVSFLLQDDNSDAAYTLIMMDPDAPSTTDRQFGPWRHWIVVNIQGSDLRNEHTPYIGPGPKPNSGEHRYIFLLFKQSKGANQSFQPMAHDTVPSRRNFDVKQFVRDHDLELVGINFFLCSATQQQ